MEVLEVGCNTGHNLLALESLGASVRGVEPNHRARTLAQKAGLRVVDGSASELPFRNGQFDLCFTAGVLIHVGTEQLDGVLLEIHRTSCRHILAVEYHAPSERRIVYRQGVTCVARDYEQEYLSRFPSLRLIADGEAPYPFNGCNWWLFERGDHPDSKTGEPTPPP